jgi:dTDP-4-dehydrorhamnose reductase
MSRLAGERPTVNVVDDQYGQPTWTVDDARRIITLVRSGGDKRPVPRDQFGRDDMVRAGA